MKAFTLFYDEVVPELPGAEVGLVLHHIKRACIDFYERSNYGRDTLAAINIVNGTASYAVAPTDPTNFEVAKVMEVRIVESGKPRQIFPRTEHQLNGEIPDWDTQGGSAKYYTQNAIDSVTLVRVPDADITGGLVVQIAKKPLYAGAGIDDAVFAKFFDGIANGAKARMMRMNKKPWTDRPAALMYENKFNLEIAAAAAIAAKSFGAGPLRTRSYA